MTDSGSPPSEDSGWGAGVPPPPDSGPPNLPPPAPAPGTGQPPAPQPAYPPPPGYPPPPAGAAYPPAPGTGPGPDQAPPPDTRPTDGFAIAALVLGLLGGILLGVVFGIVGLVRTKDGRRKGRGLAIAGIVLSTLWTILVVAVVVVAIVSRPARDAGGTVADGGRSSFSDVQVMDCLTNVQDGSVGSGVDVVPCEQPHEGQVFAKFDLPDGTYPGDDQVMAQGEAGCNERLPEQWMDLPETAGLSTFLFHPRESSWAAGDREVICAVVSDSPLTRSLPGPAAG